MKSNSEAGDTQSYDPKEGLSNESGSEVSVITPVAEPSSMGSVAPWAESLLETHLVRVVDHFFGPGAIVHEIERFLLHSSLLSIELFREAFTNMCDSKFFPIIREQITMLGFSGDKAESIVHAINRLRGLLESKIVRDVFTYQNLGDQPQIEPAIFSHRLSATILARSGNSARVWKAAYGGHGNVKPPPKAVPAEPEIASKKKIFTHGKKRAREPPTHSPDEMSEGGKTQMPECELEAYRVAVRFKPAASTFRFCNSASYSREDIRAFIILSLRNRCKTDKTLKRVTKMVKDFHDYTIGFDPPLPYHGDECLLSITECLGSLKSRGDTIPPFARYSLKVFGEALGVSFPIAHPAVKSAVSVKTKRKVKTAPPLCTEFAIALERRAADKEVLASERLYCSLFALLTVSSLRFGDTRQTTSISQSKTALCGVGVNNKGKGEDLMEWATPLTGLLGNPEWCKPITRHWEKIKPSTAGQFRALFPHINPDGRVNYKRHATFGFVQAKLSKIEKDLGFSNGVRLHSFRGWAPTCASQMRLPREEREKLGHWAPGSIMPDRYDKATCATELRIRTEILNKVREVWRPQRAFEVETKEGDAGTESDGSTSVTSTWSQKVDPRVENIADLYPNAPPPKFSDYV